MRHKHDVCIHAAGRRAWEPSCVLDRTLAQNPHQSVSLSFALTTLWRVSELKINRRPPGRARRLIRISAIGRQIKLVMATHCCFLLMMNLARGVILHANT